MDYLKDPKTIYEKSFASINSEADLSRFSFDEREIVIRLIHSCGMVDIVDDLVFSSGAAKIGKNALKYGAPIIVDVNMVAKGIIARKLPADNEVICGLDEKAAYTFAKENSCTRTAGGIEAVRHRLGGAVVAIGNAPTAVFHLLEMIEKGLVMPALILGFPVGFVGAVESKQALIDNRLDIAFITLKGRRGGSAFAASALNALAAGLET